MYGKSQKRLVSNAKNWNDMDGETMLEKRLNSVITVAYIGHLDVPSDECLDHALQIIELKTLPNGNIEEYLHEVFLQRPSKQLLDNIDKIFVKWHKEKQTSTVFN